MLGISQWPLHGAVQAWRREINEQNSEDWSLSLTYPVLPLPSSNTEVFPRIVPVDDISSTEAACIEPSPPKYQNLRQQQSYKRKQILNGSCLIKMAMGCLLAQWHLKATRDEQTPQNYVQLSLIWKLSICMHWEKYLVKSTLVSLWRWSHHTTITQHIPLPGFSTLSPCFKTFSAFSNCFIRIKSSAKSYLVSNKSKCLNFTCA